MKMKRHQARGNARGYTAMEVLMAITLFAIGGAGVISMQRATIQGGEDARRFDMATNIGNEWLSRLQRDATFWTQPNSASPNTSDLLTTRWLSQVGPCADKFCNPPMPTATPDGRSPAFDNFGRDLPSGTTGAFYCVQYRLTWIQAPGAVPPAPQSLTALMRTEVRVFWNRLEKAPLGDCSAPPPETIPACNPALPNTCYHVIYAASAVRETPLR